MELWLSYGDFILLQGLWLYWNGENGMRSGTFRIHGGCSYSLGFFALQNSLNALFIRLQFALIKPFYENPSFILS